MHASLTESIRFRQVHMHYDFQSSVVCASLCRPSCLLISVGGTLFGKKITLMLSIIKL